MPWSIERNDSCPESKPYAVVKDDDGEVEGCHESRSAARSQQAALYAREGVSKSMDHLTLKAVATPTTDEGVFEAVISTESIDREKDIVVADAMVDALRKWNRPIPLSWNHSTKPQDIFGTIEPMTVRNVKGEVVAGGQVDLDSEVGREAWRSFKNGTLGFSFGYLIPEGGSTKRKGGGRHITALDVFEVTATPTPMNNDTRVLNTKATEALRRQAETVERELVEDRIPELTEPVPEREPEPTPEQKQIATLEERLDYVTGFLLAQLDIKAVWAAAYVNGLPDSAFLYVESGEKDGEGKTVPRSKRHFPYKNAEGSVDLPHLRNALARIPQANLPDDVKDKAAAKARRILDNQGKSAMRSGDKPELDPLRKRADDIALEVVSDGERLRKPPAPVEEPKPELPPLRELRQKSRDLMIEALSGIEEVPDGEKSL